MGLKGEISGASISFSFPFFFLPLAWTDERRANVCVQEKREGDLSSLSFHTWHAAVCRKAALASPLSSFSGEAFEKVSFNFSLFFPTPTVTRDECLLAGLLTSFLLHTSAGSGAGAGGRKKFLFLNCPTKIEGD